MDGFTSLFVDAERQFNANGSRLEDFRFARHLYGFCVNEGSRDDHSLALAQPININFYTKLLEQKKSLIGYKDHEDKYLPIDDLDSKHILELTFLFDNLPEQFRNHIVEIGGGFGNMCRLSQNFFTDKQKWTIIDIPHMLELQQFYLKNELSHNKIQNIEFINGYDDQAMKMDSVDLVLGVHSLSEFSWDIFLTYFHAIIVKSKYLYLGYNKNCPSRELINKKLDFILQNGFIVQNKFDYQEKNNGAYVSYTLFKNNIS